ncbi:MAG TPA: PIG-L deacetylase family protein [Blastocatellia bacterium]|nr:PIG-L deacetylase family protein [Blastocatellia bacterium]
MAVFAHPDDESIVAGGTLARYAAAGWKTSLVCATRGEWGPISDETLATYEDLGSVRERELNAACRVLGVDELRFLDLEDGGVSAVFGADQEERVLEKIVRAIRDRRPQTVITFGPDGLYGHEDHLAIGRLATSACSLSGDPAVFPQHLTEGLPAHAVSRLFYATVPRGFYSELVVALARSGHEAQLWGIPPEQFGIPGAEITVRVDVSPFLDRKLEALRCHRTQLDADHVFSLLTRELAFEHFNCEFFRQAF